MKKTLQEIKTNYDNMSQAYEQLQRNLHSVKQDKMYVDNEVIEAQVCVDKLLLLGHSNLKAALYLSCTHAPVRPSAFSNLPRTSLLQVVYRVAPFFVNRLVATCYKQT